MGFRKRGTIYKTKKGRLVRSKLEVKVLNQLDELGVEYEYEPRKYEWIDPIRNGLCDTCGSESVGKRRLYVPDILLKKGTVIEVKGRLTTRDRRLIKSIRKRYPSLDYKLLFDRDNKISRASQTRYSDWARENGIEYGLKGVVPKEWL